MTEMRRAPHTPSLDPRTATYGALDLSGFDTDYIGDYFRPTGGLWDIDGLYALYVSIGESMVSTLSLCGDAALYLISVTERGDACFCYRGFFPDPGGHRRSFQDPECLRIQFSGMVMHPMFENSGNRATGSLELNGTLVLRSVIAPGAPA